MPSAALIRNQIEAALAHQIPSALTPVPKIIRPVSPTGIRALDEVLEGGLPLGAITEIVGFQRVKQEHGICAGKSVARVHLDVFRKRGFRNVNIFR